MSKIKTDRRKLVVIAVIMIAVGLIFSLSKSYAYFETSIAGSNVTLGVGKLIHSLNSDVRLKSGEKKEINLFVKSNDDIDSKYQVYYTSNDDLTDVLVGYSNDSVDLPSGEIEAKGSKSISIVLENNSSNDVSIEIGVKGGLAKKLVEDIILEEGENRVVNALEGITEIGDINITLNAGETYTIPQGYHNGSGTITVLPFSEINYREAEYGTGYSYTLGPSGSRSITIKFQHTFSKVPLVGVNVYGSYGIKLDGISSVTTDSFTFSIKNFVSNTSYTTQVSWVAVAQD